MEAMRRALLSHTNLACRNSRCFSKKSARLATATIVNQTDDTKNPNKETPPPSRLAATTNIVTKQTNKNPPPLSMPKIWQKVLSDHTEAINARTVSINAGLASFENFQKEFILVLNKKLDLDMGISGIENFKKEKIVFEEDKRVFEEKKKRFEEEKECFDENKKKSEGSIVFVENAALEKEKEKGEEASVAVAVAATAEAPEKKKNEEKEAIVLKIEKNTVEKKKKTFAESIDAVKVAAAAKYVKLTSELVEGISKIIEKLGEWGKWIHNFLFLVAFNWIRDEFNKLRKRKGVKGTGPKGDNGDTVKTTKGPNGPGDAKGGDTGGDKTEKAKGDPGNGDKKDEETLWDRICKWIDEWVA